jgi:hypothetical protein
VIGPPGNGRGLLFLVSNADKTLQSLDPDSRALGPAQELGEGPHAVALDAAYDGAVRQILVASAGAGTLTRLNADASEIVATTSIGGRPVGVAPASRASSSQAASTSAWVADADAGAVLLVNLTSGEIKQSIPVSARLSSMDVTADRTHLVLSSDDSPKTLYAVDVSKAQIDPQRTEVKELQVDNDVLALAVGLEPSMAFFTTADNQLHYWNLASNTITKSIAVGRGPISLTLGFANPSGTAALRTPGGSVDTGSDSGGGGQGTAAAANRSSQTQSSSAGGQQRTATGGGQTGGGGSAASAGPASSGGGSGGNATGSAARVIATAVPPDWVAAGRALPARAAAQAAPPARVEAGIARAAPSERRAEGRARVGEARRLVVGALLAGQAAL